MSLLWIAIAVVVAVALTLLFSWVKRNNVKPAWWVWLIGALGLLLLLMTIQFYIGTTLEMYPTAATMGLAIFGVPAVVLLAAAAWRIAAAGKSSQSSG